jgi:hypothetical protein
MKVDEPLDDATKDAFGRGEGFPQIVHDRSRDVGRDLQKLLVSLSTGTLAIYFLALTTEAKPGLTHHQTQVSIVALALMALAVGSGLFGMYADTRRNYFWASALQKKDKNAKSLLYKHRDRWLRTERIMDLTLAISFLAGITMSVIYMFLRVLSR